jgi:DNA polymerase III gamma/tau subunit
LNKGIEDGADPLEMYRGLVDYMRAALLVHSQLPAEMLDLSGEEIEKIRSMQLDRDEIMSMLDLLLKSEELIKRSMNARIAIELLMCQLVRSGAARPEDKVPNSDDFKNRLFKTLQSHSPKLAALLHKSVVKVAGKDVSVTAENEFTQKQLLQSKEVIEKVLKKVLNHDVDLRVDVADNAKQDNSLEDTIRVLFDGEEVR